MDIKEYFKVTDLPEEMVKGANRAKRSLSLNKDKKKILALTEKIATDDYHVVRDDYKELRALLKDDPGCFKMLYCQSLSAVRAYDEYVKKGIPDEIFTDTMKAFRRFSFESLVRHGKMYFDRDWWTYRQVSMNLFRIGALEYEFADFCDEPVISVHIPSDADMRADAVDASLDAARDFIRKYYPEYDGRPFACESWLLSPNLKLFLDEDSRILSFASRFEIKKELPDNMDCIEWLFNAEENVPYEELPENTTLQRKVKEYILNGNKLGAAYGILTN